MNRIGIDLGGTKIAVAVIAPSGESLYEKRLPTPVDDYVETLQVVNDLVADAEGATGMVSGSARVGVGTPGAESSVDGRIKNANSTILNGRPLHRDLARLLKRPLRLANDANCMALSESRDGAGMDVAVVFGVILGTGVGGGLVINQQLVGGANRIAGEWGHNQLPWSTSDEQPGLPCYCGAVGCVETWLSGPGLSADYQRAGGDPVITSALAICEREQQGDSLAGLVMANYYSRLARALAAVINLLDPHVIVVAGGLSNHPPIYEQVPKLWQQWIFSDQVETQLVKAAHGDASGVRGAAWLWPL